MEYMFGEGFFETRAPYFMDIFVLTKALLPVLLALTIVFAIKRRYNLHQFMQKLLFTLTLLVLIYAAYGLYAQGGIELYMAKSSINLQVGWYALVLYSTVTTIMMILWYSTIRFAVGDRKRRALPGLYSSGHKKLGRVVGLTIFASALLGLVLYWVLFLS
ncbi:MAG: DUF420 domain-containing protein [Epsilonproteobacteria bacterium]|nr:DUF420 domain-containing protein [Campylobacterota bacterium]